MQNRIRDLLLYIAISFAVLLIPFAAAKGGISGDAFVKCLGFAAFTSVLFGYVIVDSRELWKRTKFWSFMFISFFVHACAFWVLLAHYTTFKPVWFALISVPEMFILLAFKNMLFCNRIAS